MQIGDFFSTPTGAVLKLERISNTDVCCFRDIELNVKLPLDRAVAEARLGSTQYIWYWSGSHLTITHLPTRASRIVGSALAREFAELMAQLDDDASRDRACALYWGMGSLPQHCGGVA